MRSVEIPVSRSRVPETQRVRPECRRLTPLDLLVAFIAVFTISSAAGATEGGGSNYPSGIGTVNQGTAPNPPGFVLRNYDVFYTANRVNNGRGDKAVPDFHVDVMASSLRLDYTLEPIGGIRFGIQLIQSLVRANLSVGRGPGALHQEKAGLSDFGFTPFVAGWEFDTPIGHVNQHATLNLSIPTGSFRATAPVNLGRNYITYNVVQGNSLFPTENTHIGFELTHIINEKNPATNYQSGREINLDWSAGYTIDHNWSLDIQGFFYKQLTNDYRAGVLVNGDGNKGQTVGIGPQIRFKFHPGAITLKWQTEMAVRNRAEGNFFWLQAFYPF